MEKFEPCVNSEYLMFNTVRLESFDGSCGTGFFYKFDIDGKQLCGIVTNKHVVGNASDAEMSFFLHLTEDGKTPCANFRVNYKTKWFFHPTQDLCFTPCDYLFSEVYSLTGKRVFYMELDSKIVYGKEKLKELRACEPIVMVGYPNGLWDRYHNFPIFRYGFTATHPGFDYNNNGIGLIDASCIPGSSGSPVFIYNMNGYSDKNMNYYMQERLIFLGILFKGHTLDAQGRIEAVEIPTKIELHSMTKIMINLGLYIKAYELEAFIPMVKAYLSSSVGKSLN